VQYTGVIFQRILVRSCPYLGFSAHSEQAALAAMDRYDFDSVLFPINFATFYKGDFSPKVIAAANSKGTAILALKSLARQQWPQGDSSRKQYPKCWYQPLTEREDARLGLYFTLSQPITAATPPGEESLFRMALNAIFLDISRCISYDYLCGKISVVFSGIFDGFCSQGEK